MAQTLLRILRTCLLIIAALSTVQGLVGALISFATPRGQAWSYLDDMASALISVVCLLIVQRACPPPLKNRTFLPWLLLDCLAFALAWWPCGEMVSRWIPTEWTI